MIHVQSERFHWCLWLICDCLSIVTVAMMLPVTVAMILVDEFWPLVQLFRKTNDLVCDFSWEETWCVWRLGFMPSPSFRLQPLELQEVQDTRPIVHAYQVFLQSTSGMIHEEMTRNKTPMLLENKRMKLFPWKDVIMRLVLFAFAVLVFLYWKKWAQTMCSWPL